MEFLLLGPVELWHDGRRLPLGPARQRCVLAALLAGGSRPVRTETLIDRVWGDEPPVRAREVLYTYIARLRQALREVPAPLQRRAGGYLLDVPEDDVDLHRFTSLMVQARDAPDDRSRIERLRAASGLWRGTALDGLSGDWVARTREGLERQRMGLLTDRFELELRLGNQLAVLDELSDLVTAHPTVEPLAGHLMVALHRAGRQSEALQVFRDIRERLSNELGLQPSAALRQVEAAVLADIPRTATAARAGPAGAKEGRRVPAQLPAAPAVFVGREAALLTLQRECRTAPAVIAIVGPAGVGKTAMALRWSWAARDDFPDGQLHLDLQGFGDGSPMEPAAALDRMLRAIDVATEHIPHDVDERAALFRSHLADRRMLLMLDNAASAHQIRPLLPGGQGCVVVVTSRHRLDGLVAAEGARRITLTPLSGTDAATLIRRIAPAEICEDTELLDRLIVLCDRLPLAVRVVAARLDSSTTLKTVVNELEDEDARLSALTVLDDEVSVRRALGFSVRSLDTDGRRVFALLGLHPGRQPSPAACAALTGLDLAGVRACLHRLIGVHLVEHGRPGRYRMHDLIRLVARAEAAALPDRDAALRRVLVWYRDAANAADRVLRPSERPNFTSDTEPLAFAGTADAIEWLDEEAENLAAAVEHGCVAFPEIGWQIAAAMYGWLVRRRDLDRWIGLYTTAAEAAARAGDTAGEAMMSGRLAIPHSLLEQHEQAAACCRRACELRRGSGDILGAATALLNLGAVHINAGQPAEAIRWLAEAATISTPLAEAGHLRALLQSNLGEAHSLAGTGRAVEHFGLALALAERHCSARDIAEILRRLAAAHRSDQRYAEAARYADRAVVTARSAGDPLLEAEGLEELARASAALGRPEQGVRHLRRALSICETMNNPHAQALRCLLDVMSGEGSRAEV